MVFCFVKKKRQTWKLVQLEKAIKIRISWLCSTAEWEHLETIFDWVVQHCFLKRLLVYCDYKQFVWRTLSIIQNACSVQVHVLYRYWIAFSAYIWYSRDTFNNKTECLYVHVCSFKFTKSNRTPHGQIELRTWICFWVNE